MKKRILSLVLAIVMITSIFVLSGCDKIPIFDILSSGKYLEFALLDDGTYSVSLKEGASGVKSIAIPSTHKGKPVTVIEPYAFKGAMVMTSISIPDTITTIGEYAFLDCDCLDNVKIPDSVTYIGDRAFEYCRGLTNVYIGSGVSFIGDAVFHDCCLFSITLGSENTTYYIDGNCLIEKSSNELVVGTNNSVIPDGITAIRNSAFAGCRVITSVRIPDSVKYVGDHAFYNCYMLADLVMGNGVEYIGEKAFHYCIKITNIVIPDSVSHIGEQAFFCMESLKTLTIGSGITSIPEQAFYNCYHLTDVVIADSVTHIGKEAFTSCPNIQNVYYMGSEADWEKIVVDEGNTDLKGATVHFDYVPER